MIIRVKAFPKSKLEEVKKIKEGKFEIRVRADAKNNFANQRIMEILKSYFPEAKGIRLIRGSTRPNKIFEVIEPQDILI